MISKYGAAEQSPKRIIIHAMGEHVRDVGKNVYTAEAWLAHLKVSAHLLIFPNGFVDKLRDFEKGAYHARGFNVDSIGVEFLVPGVHDYGSFLKKIKTDWVSPHQQKAGVEICQYLINKYDITKIDRHSDVSPGRKVDPGSGFDWGKFTGLLGLDL